MNINLSKAHALTSKDNKKLYEVKEIVRLEHMVDAVRAQHINMSLSQTLCTEQEYRAALSLLDKPVMKPAPKEKKNYANKQAIINSHSQTAYVLPDDYHFSTDSNYSTFTHDKLSQLSDDHQQMIRKDLRRNDILRLEEIHKASQQYYKIVELRACEL